MEAELVRQEFPGLERFSELGRPLRSGWELKRPGRYELLAVTFLGKDPVQVGTLIAQATDAELHLVMALYWAFQEKEKAGLLKLSDDPEDPTDDAEARTRSRLLRAVGRLGRAFDELVEPDVAVRMKAYLWFQIAQMPYYTWYRALPPNRTLFYGVLSVQIADTVGGGTKTGWIALSLDQSNQQSVRYGTSRFVCVRVTARDVTPKKGAPSDVSLVPYADEATSSAHWNRDFNRSTLSPAIALLEHVKTMAPHPFQVGRDSGRYHHLSTDRDILTYAALQGDDQHRAVLSGVCGALSDTLPRIICLPTGRPSSVRFDIGDDLMVKPVIRV